MSSRKASHLKENTMTDKTDALVDVMDFLQDLFTVASAERAEAVSPLLQKHDFERDEILPLTRELFAGLPGFD